ncbi:hypothetical protein ACFQRD_02690 [Brachybacterium sp. GCM10030268]|uniref:hypothetical protein n=1 Tax=Brachybacterium sp. GCM10030268 TaxID=3273382 RepID=UPI003610B193
MATNYTADGTYWTGRVRDNGNLEVVRLRSDGYVTVQSIGSYIKHGSAVAAAAQLAYAQGQADARAELSAAIFTSLAGVGISPVTVEAPDEEPDPQD